MLPGRRGTLIKLANLAGLPIERFEGPVRGRVCQDISRHLQPDHPGSGDRAGDEAGACRHGGEQSDVAAMQIDQPDRLALLGPTVSLRLRGVRGPTELIVIRHPVVLRVGLKVPIPQVQGELADLNLPPCLLHREGGQVRREGR